MPNISLSNFNLRPSAASVRTDTRVTTSYTLSRPIKKHQMRFGADFRYDASSSQSPPGQTSISGSQIASIASTPVSRSLFP